MKKADFEMQNSLSTLLIFGIKIAAAFSYTRLLLNLCHDDRSLYLPCPLLG